MKWISLLSRQRSLDECLQECTAKLAEQPLATVGFVAVFVSFDFNPGFARLLERLEALFPTATIVGCSANGIIGDGEEAEFVSGLSLTLGWLPGVEVRCFHLEREDLPDLDAAPTVWRQAILGDATDLRGILLLGEPFSFPGDGFLAGLDYAYPQATKLGGLASGGQTAGGTALFCNGRVISSGVVGIGFFGEVRVDAVVAQGCRPIGKSMVITACQYNEIATLDGQCAGEAVLATLRALPPRDQKLAAQLLFIGIGAGGPKLDYGPGDFLIRQVLGVEPDEHSLVVNAAVRKGQTVQLHLRDHRSSSDDLELMLEKHLRGRCENPAKGGLLFSCLGRGRSLYGYSDHDSNLFRAKLGDVPLGGFFGNGELGPVGGATSLHGYTSCFVVFSERESQG